VGCERKEERTDFWGVAVTVGNDSVSLAGDIAGWGGRHCKVMGGLRVGWFCREVPVVIVGRVDGVVSFCLA
jgi:hypothetical protein